MQQMLTDDQMYEALLNKDSSYEGIFIAGVKTTGIFCRPTCTARKPKRENVEFFRTTKEAIQHGYRACKVCKPLELPNETPAGIKALLHELEDDPSRKLKDQDLRNLQLDPFQVRRWFLKNHGITFHAYQRMHRVNSAFKKIQQGEKVTTTAYDAGYESVSGFSDSFKAVFGVSPSNSRKQAVIDLTRIETPLGTMIACAVEEGVCMLEFSDRKMLETELKVLAKYFNATIVQGQNKYFDQIKKELEEYFVGKRKAFTVPLSAPGTDFQKKVWKALMDIPYATTASYQQQALRLSNPNAVRAVGTANGMNRIAIIIPCHRVIGADGQLTGYGGGLWRKKWLLDLEQNNA